VVDESDVSVEFWARPVEAAKIRRSEDQKIRRSEDQKIRRSEDL
jgi:hypothetical protein